MKPEEFLENISGDTTLIFHNDGDGVCSGTLIYNYLRAKGIKVKLFSGDIDKRTFERAEVSENVIMVDLAVDQYPEFIDKFKKSNVLIIDHHPIKNDLNKIGFIHINPRFKDPDIYKSASEECYEILKNISKPKEWLMRVGGVSDCSLKGDGKETLAANMIASIKAVKRTIYFPELAEYLSTCETLDDFITNKEFIKIHEGFEKELKRVLEETDFEERENIIFFEITSEYGVKSVIANALFEKYPDKTIIVYTRNLEQFNISARSHKVDVGELLKKASEGIGKGGGHPKAAAATVNDFEKFKKKLIELTLSSEKIN